MNKKFKKIMSVILCAVMLLAVLPFSSMAVDKKTPPYVSVEAPFADERKELSVGQSTEVTIDWGPPEGVSFTIEYYASDDCCEVEFIPDDRGGVSGANVTAVSCGSCFIGFEILDVQGEILATDSIEIYVTEADNRTLLERVGDFFKGMVGTALYSAVIGMVYVVLPMLASPLVTIAGWFK